MIERLRRGISKQFSSKLLWTLLKQSILPSFSHRSDEDLLVQLCLTHTVQTNLDASQVAHSKKRERESVISWVLTL